jgi:hypothetical protein
MQEVLIEAELRVEEYKEAYLETGGTEEGFKEKNMSVTVENEIYMQNDKYLSFRVFTHETLAAVYSENLYFTIDLENNRIMSLTDLLGDDYKNKIISVIAEDYKMKSEEYFDTTGEDIETGQLFIRDDLSFYMNNNKEIVVVFGKYELKPGALGRPEYIIK